MQNDFTGSRCFCLLPIPASMLEGTASFNQIFLLEHTHTHTYRKKGTGLGPQSSLPYGLYEELHLIDRHN